MASYASPRPRHQLRPKRCEGYRNFCNKLWNATRFVLMNCEGQDCGLPTTAAQCTRRQRGPYLHFSQADRWIASELQRRGRRRAGLCRPPARQRRQRGLRVRLGRVLRLVPRDRQGAAAVRRRHAAQRATRRTLIRVLETVLRLLHPLTPFITAELWGSASRRSPGASPRATRAASSSPYPQAQPERIDPAADAWVARLKAVVGSCRALRSEMGSRPAHGAAVRARRRRVHRRSGAAACSRWRASPKVRAFDDDARSPRRPPCAGRGLGPGAPGAARRDRRRCRARAARQGNHAPGGGLAKAAPSSGTRASSSARLRRWWPRSSAASRSSPTRWRAWAVSWPV